MFQSFKKKTKEKKKRINYPKNKCIRCIYKVSKLVIECNFSCQLVLRELSGQSSVTFLDLKNKKKKCNLL